LKYAISLRSRAGAASSTAVQRATTISAGSSSLPFRHSVQSCAGAATASSGVSEQRPTMASKVRCFDMTGAINPTSMTKRPPARRRGQCHFVARGVGVVQTGAGAARKDVGGRNKVQP
jgi:hypothetical protein